MHNGILLTPSFWYIFMCILLKILIEINFFYRKENKRVFFCLFFNAW